MDVIALLDTETAITGRQSMYELDVICQMRLRAQEINIPDNVFTTLRQKG